MFLHYLTVRGLVLVFKTVSTHESLDATVDAQHTSRSAEVRQLTDDFRREALNLLLSVLQQVDQAHDAAELLQRHADSLACAHLAQDFQCAHLYVTSHQRTTATNRSFVCQQRQSEAVIGFALGAQWVAIISAGGTELYYHVELPLT